MNDVVCSNAIAGKPAPTGLVQILVGAAVRRFDLPAMRPYQPPMIFMMVAPPENATSCLSPKAFTKSLCKAGKA
ncbi:hypothetical protein FQ185_12350 [Pseudomonas sp. ANT_H12B]|nr:hypothetical protein FQ185_12350 [Pseudomonas sp. ANT_H12B]